MKISILFFSIALSVPVLAQASCFLAKENNKVVQQEGDCKKRYAPCSTFKIALSLMGYDSGVLIDANHPEWEFKEGYVDWFDQWKRSYTPAFWIKNSCVWFSQVLTKKLGMLKFKTYVKKFIYGNQDVSGDKGKNNGLTNSWLSSSLEISPEEQIIVFANHIVDGKKQNTYAGPRAKEDAKIKLMQIIQTHRCHK